VPTVTKASSFAEKFHHNHRMIARLPKKLAEDCLLVMHDNDAFYGAVATHTPEDAHRILKAKVNGTSFIAVHVRDFLNARAQNAGLTGFKLLEL
jgi:hypothetical protein